MSAGRYCPSCLTTFRDEPERCPNLGCGRARPSTGWGRVLEPGELLDRHYRIEKVLAVGGAGLTYLAREVDTDGDSVGPLLAIKVLYHARATGPYLRRLSTEAQILQELDHPHIVQLHGFVHRAGHAPYLVTLFEEGGTLTQHVERHGPLPVRTAADILLQIVGALDVAHERGVIHRDLKPDNVLLHERCTRDVTPQVRIADFGIAKVNDALGGGLTRSGAFVGTPEFAAPEQFDGVPPTPATDVFAAGALFVFLLTGAAPVRFQDRADVERCGLDWLQALPYALDPSRLDGDPTTNEVVAGVVRQMLAQHPEQRPTMKQVMKRLQQVVSGTATLAPTRDTLDLTARPPPGRPENTAMLDPDDDDDTSGGCAALIAGAGVLGAGVVLGGGALAVLLLGIAAWQWGYFSADAPVVLDATEERPADGRSEEERPPDGRSQEEQAPDGRSEEERPPDGHSEEEQAPEEPDAEDPPPHEAADPATAGLPLLAATDPARLDLQRRLQDDPDLGDCGYEGVILVTLWLERGSLRRVQTDPAGAASCFEQQLRGKNLQTHGIARIAIHR